MDTFFTIVPSAVQYVAVGLLAAWMIYEGLYDFKDQNIPLFFSIVPLAAGSVYWLTQGDWPYVLAILALVAVTNFRNTLLACLSALVLVVAAFVVLPAHFYPALVAFILAYGLFVVGVMGGADSMAMIYVVFWFPDYGTIACLLVGIVIYSAVRLLLRDGKDAALSLLVRVKTRTLGEQRTPGIFGFSVGVVLYVAALLLG